MYSNVKAALTEERLTKLLGLMSKASACPYVLGSINHNSTNSPACDGEGSDSDSDPTV